MHPNSLVTQTFAASLIGAAAHAAQPTPPDNAEAQLRAINHRAMQAIVGRDSEFMNALTHKDFLFTATDGTWHDRAGFIAQTAKPTDLRGVSYDDVRLRLFGDVALVHGVTEALPRRGAPSRVRYTDVYVWSGGAWWLVSAHHTPLKPAVAVALRQGTAPAHAHWSGIDPSGDDLAVLKTLNENYVKAFREADVAWYAAHLSTDYLVVQGDGALQDRAMALERFAKPTFATQMNSFPVDKVNIRRFGDVAVIHAENDYELKDGSKGVSRYTDIWHKRDGRWLCVAAHITAHTPGR